MIRYKIEANFLIQTRMPLTTITFAGHRCILLADELFGGINISVAIMNRGIRRRLLLISEKHLPQGYVDAYYLVFMDNRIP